MKLENRKIIVAILCCLLLALCSCGQAQVSETYLQTTRDTTSATVETTTDVSTTTVKETTRINPTTTTKAKITPAVTTETIPTTTQSTTAETIATTTETKTTTAVTKATTSETTKPTPVVTPTSTSQALDEAAALIHREALVIDTHCDTVLKIIDSSTWLPKVNISQTTSFMVDIPKLQTGGIDLQVFASYTSGYAQEGGGQDFAKANSRLLALINGVKWTLRKNPQSLLPVERHNDIELAVQSGKTGVMASIEGAYSFSDTTGIELLKQYRDLGIRMLALTWNYSNALGEGVNETYRDGKSSSGGLTDLGRAVVIEMNKMGIIVDVSHLNEATFWDVLAVTSVPVIASHSSADYLCQNVRNLNDSQIQAIAASGGVVHVNFHRPFLAADADSVTIDTLVDHIDHIVDLVGIDFVGLGSDFDGAKMPQGLENASKVPMITRELLARGYAEDDINKILGGNANRLIRAVFAHASQLLPVSGVPVIVPELAMGTGIPTGTPVLNAVINHEAGKELDLDSLAIVVDGVVYSPEYDAATRTITLALTAPLTEKFHVVTFLAAFQGGETARETLVFYIK
ncbi:MAG: dipeptidase [Bacillota bacterium]|nr:dipeptidase [Bacillota bacterium]